MSVLLIIADRRKEKQVAISRGVALAKKLGASVEVVGFCWESLAPLGLNKPTEQSEARKKIMAQRKEDVQAEVDKAKPDDLRVSVSVVWEKDIHHWVIRRCSGKPYVAVVKTGHRTETFMYTSTDWYLLRECPAPVMIVAEKKWRSTLPVLAAVDTASKRTVKLKLNLEIIEQAKRYAQALDVPLYIIQAMHISPVLTDLDLVDVPQRESEIKKELEPKLRDLSRKCGVPMKRFSLRRGPVDKVITSEAAKLKAQLLVMGTVGRSGVKAKLLGNTAESVLQRLRTDVLALKP